MIERWCPGSVVVKMTLRDENAVEPKYATREAAGCDLVATTPLTLKPLERGLVGTGVYLDMPPGYEGQIRARSGLASKHGVTVLNGVGTCDSDYRGEIRVLLVNLSDQPYEVKVGDRVAQLVFSQVVQANFVDEELSSTHRGSGGFGSTGS